MAIHRTRRPRTTPDATGGATPPDAKAGAGGDDDDSDDDSGEGGDGSPSAGGDDDDSDDEAPVGKPPSETAKELGDAEQLALDQHRARTKVREREITRQQSSGAGFVNYDEVRKLEDAAAARVLAKSRMTRGKGVYVASSITVADEEGKRIELVEGCKLPDAIVSKLANTPMKGHRSEFAKLVTDGVLDDLR